MNSPSPIVEETVHFSSDDLRLEGVLSYPEDGAPTAALLLLAPHPHLGGAMNNNVLLRIASRAAENGAVALRFNYRGVGASEIHLDAGVSLYNHWERMESDQRYESLAPDCVAALEFLAHAASLPSVALVGYSLGSILAGIVAPHPAVDRIVGISPPIARAPLTVFRQCAKPKLFVAGAQDVFSPEGLLAAACATFPPPCQRITLAECDHFYRKNEDRVFDALSPFAFAAP